MIFFYNLDFTMLPRIESKTNVIALLQSVLVRLLFGNAYIPGWLVTLQNIQ